MQRRMSSMFGAATPDENKDYHPMDFSSQLPSPISEIAHVQRSISSSINLTQYEHRGSISTERTSLSDWSTRRDAASNSMDFDESRYDRRLVKSLPRRPKGAYRLGDFIIQRTLGTGSFGRVHLGESLLVCSSQWLTHVSKSAEQTQPSFLRDQGLEQGTSRQDEAG